MPRSAQHQEIVGDGRQSPHVVWLMCDQLRADALGFAGNTASNIAWRSKTRCRRFDDFPRPARQTLT